MYQVFDNTSLYYKEPLTSAPFNTLSGLIARTGKIKLLQFHLIIGEKSQKTNLGSNGAVESIIRRVDI